MTELQVHCVCAVFAILFAVTLIATRGWLRHARASAVLYALAGCGTMVLLRVANLPPNWFDGGAEGFGLAIMLMLTAITFRTPAQKAFGVPLLLSLGGTLFALNVLAHF